uniref:Exostosin GT47 domain-containing protein n=1 Tax=Prymnesium polylepis TaxID=72548 RepID=A0A7S4MFK4_9EUKA
MLGSRLVHLSLRTAARHIFLQTVDSCHMGLNQPRDRYGHVSPLIPSDAIVFHLGDDVWNAGRVRSAHPMKRATRFPRSIVVPYRAQYAEPSSGTPSRTKSARRPLLVFGAFSAERHPLRRSLIGAMVASESLAPGRIRVGGIGLKHHCNSSRAVTRQNCGRVPRFEEWSGSNISVDDQGALSAALGIASEATFCLCPSGDTPSLTPRLYTSILAGCVPVVIDLYARYPLDLTRAYPFPSLIDWHRFVVEVPHNRSSMPRIEKPKTVADSKQMYARFRRAIEAEMATLVPRLLQLEQHAAEARRYMRSIAHWLRYDMHATDRGRQRRLVEQDAASAALHELALRLQA